MFFYVFFQNDQFISCLQTITALLIFSVFPVKHGLTYRQGEMQTFAYKSDLPLKCSYDQGSVKTYREYLSDVVQCRLNNIIKSILKSFDHQTHLT